MLFSSMDKVYGLGLLDLVFGNGYFAHVFVLLTVIVILPTLCLSGIKLY